VSETENSDTQRPECYHYDCSKDATRIHHDTVPESDPAPCCDDHEPMYATEMWTPIDEPQATLDQAGGGRNGRSAGTATDKEGSQ
jgi:hypothetical protein